MQSDALIVKSNSLIRSRYDYTLAELRLVITVASMIEADDKDFKDYSVEALQFAELMGATKGNTYTSLKELGKMLLSKPLEIPTSTGFAICNWFSWYEYKENEGRIECSFHPKLKPHLLELKKHFTQYNLEHILKMKSTYSIRLFELAKSWESTGYFLLSVDDFKKTMGCFESYERHNDLKRYVIDRAIKEINELSDIEITYSEKKTGRKVSGLEFKVKTKIKQLKNEIICTGIHMSPEQFDRFIVQIDSAVIDMKDLKKEAIKLSNWHGTFLDLELLKEIRKALEDFRKANRLF